MGNYISLSSSPMLIIHLHNHLLLNGVYVCLCECLHAHSRPVYHLKILNHMWTRTLSRILFEILSFNFRQQAFRSSCSNKKYCYLKLKPLFLKRKQRS